MSKNISCDGTIHTGSHWSVLSDDKQIVCIDFDHTISKKCLACDDSLKGDGIQDGAIEAVILLSKKFRIWIYTGSHPDYEERDIDKFLRFHGIRGYVERIVRTKPPAIFIVDDRAVHHTSWKSTLNEIDRRLVGGLY